MSEVTHQEIARKVEENGKDIAAVDRKVDDLRAEVTEMRTQIAKTLELVEAYAAIKTGGKAVAWMSKFLAGLLAIWVLIKGGAQFLVELGRS